MSAEPPAPAEPGSPDPIGVRFPNTARIWNYQLGGDLGVGWHLCGIGIKDRP